MAEVGVASRTEHFRSNHSETIVRLYNDIQWRNWFKIAGPARPRFEFGGSAKKVGATAYTLEDARLVNFVKWATTRGFCFTPGGDFVLLLSQQLFPFRV